MVARAHVSFRKDRRKYQVIVDNHTPQAQRILFDSEEEAIALADKINKREGRLRRATPVRVGIEFGPYAERWYMKAIKVTSGKIRYHASCRSALDCHLLPYFGTWELSAIGPEDAGFRRAQA